jgi:hypothetical protein
LLALLFPLPILSFFNPRNFFCPSLLRNLRNTGNFLFDFIINQAHVIEELQGQKKAAKSKKEQKWNFKAFFIAQKLPISSAEAALACSQASRVPLNST